MHVPVQNIDAPYFRQEICFTKVLHKSSLFCKLFCIINALRDLTIKRKPEINLLRHNHIIKNNYLFV